MHSLHKNRNVLIWLQVLITFETNRNLKLRCSYLNTLYQRNFKSMDPFWNLSVTNQIHFIATNRSGPLWKTSFISKLPDTEESHINTVTDNSTGKYWSNKFVPTSKKVQSDKSQSFLKKSSFNIQPQREYSS